MGTKLFGVDVAKEVAKGMASGLLPVTLTVVTPGTRGTPITAGTNPTRVGYPCRGLVEDYSEGQIDGEFVLQGDRRVMILGGTLPDGVVPKGGDEVTIQNRTYGIVRVGTDPANAVYSCQSRQ